MVDLFLVVFVVAIIAVAIFANVRILMHFQQPEDSGLASSVLNKVVIVASLTLAWVMNLLLPIDVRNSRPRPGMLDMELIWQAVFVTLALFLVIIVPASLFYSEVEGDPTVKTKRRYVLCNLCLTLFFSVCTVAISFPFLAHAAIPVTEYSCDQWQDASVAAESASGAASKICSSGTDAVVEFRVGFQVYLIAVQSFIGWFFFVMFGGIGLGAVPLDLVLGFIDRPRAIDEATYQQRKRLLGKAASTLMEQAESIQVAEADSGQSRWTAWRARRAVQSDYNRFKRDVLLLESEFENLRISKMHQGENLAVSTVKLLVGILSAILSLMWVFHIILKILVPQIDSRIHVEFIDAIFSACEGSGIYPLGVALFALFTFYLLICVVKGCLKFGMRLFFLFSIHPMKRQGTPLNSILFNVEMVLITSAAVVQFAQTAFSSYLRLTASDIIFSAQVKYMSFFKFFFERNIFIYALLGWFLLTTLYLLIRPRESAAFKPNKKVDSQLAKIIGAASTAQSSREASPRS